MKNEAIAPDASPAFRPRRFERGGARAFHRVLLEYGEVTADPLAPLEDHELARLLDRIPATTPLELRDRALFELAYASGLRAEELVDLDVASVLFDAEEVRVEGKGSKTRLVPVGEEALRAIGRWLERGRPLLAAPGDAELALFLSRSGRRLSTSDVRRRL